MPTAAPKPCSQCGVLVSDGSSRCQAHKTVQWTKRPEVQRITGRKLQGLRYELFCREPLCRICWAEGRTTLATIRDHIQPLAEGGTEDDSNIQPICADCDDVKSKAERLRARGIGPAPAVLGLPMPRASVAQGPAPARGFTAHPGGGEKSGGVHPETDLLVKFLRAQVSGEGGVSNAGKGQILAAAGGAI
jgi:5-methylcytosine-specific restriction enzyme A